MSTLDHMTDADVQALRDKIERMRADRDELCAAIDYLADCSAEGTRPELAMKSDWPRSLRTLAQNLERMRSRVRELEAQTNRLPTKKLPQDAQAKCPAPTSAKSRNLLAGAPMRVRFQADKQCPQCRHEGYSIVQTSDNRQQDLLWCLRCGVTATRKEWHVAAEAVKEKP